MSYIPNCRENEFYNIEKLDEIGQADIKGFDWAIEVVVDNLFDNLDFFDDDVIERFFEFKHDYKIEYNATNRFLGDEDRKVETYGDYIRYKILEWAEMHRNELIVSMIDSYEPEIDDSENNK